MSSNCIMFISRLGYRYRSAASKVQIPTTHTHKHTHTTQTTTASHAQGTWSIQSLVTPAVGHT